MSETNQKQPTPEIQVRRHGHKVIGDRVKALGRGTAAGILTGLQVAIGTDQALTDFSWDSIEQDGDGWWSFVQKAAPHA